MADVVRLSTPRLAVRDLRTDDLDALHELLDSDLGMSYLDRGDRARWLTWTVLDYEFRARAHQPPSAEYGLELVQTGELIGCVGLVPSLMPFGQLPGYGGPPGRAVPEVGLFWAVASAHQRCGYAVEAAEALCDFAFTALGLRRIVATTEHGNVASAAVMRALGMRVEANPGPDPFYLQVVGWLDNPHPPAEWAAAP